MFHFFPRITSYVDVTPSYRQKILLRRWQTADCSGHCSQSLYVEVGGLRMHPQGALWPMTKNRMMRRRKKRTKGPGEPALSLHDGGRSRMMRRKWTGDRSLSLCGAGSGWNLGLRWPPEETPRRARWGLVTLKKVEEVTEKEEDPTGRTVHHSRIPPLHMREGSPGHPPPWWSCPGQRSRPSPSWKKKTKTDINMGLGLKTVTCVTFYWITTVVVICADGTNHL